MGGASFVEHAAAMAPGARQACRSARWWCLPLLARALTRDRSRTRRRWTTRSTRSH